MMSNIQMQTEIAKSLMRKSFKPFMIGFHKRPGMKNPVVREGGKSNGIR